MTTLISSFNITVGPEHMQGLNLIGSQSFPAGITTLHDVRSDKKHPLDLKHWRH